VRLVGRNDTSLAAALIVGALLLFQQPLRLVFDAASEIERQYHLDLTQALVVLGVVFIFHVYRKGHEAKAEAVAATAEAQQSKLRSQELERLVGLSRGLASVTDYAGLSQAVGRYLPQFTSDRATWILIRPLGTWDVLIQDADDRRTADQLELVAGQVLEAERGAVAHPEGHRVGDLACFPMMAGTQPIGMLQVRNVPALSFADCKALEAVAAMAAIAVRNVRTLNEIRDNSLRDGLTGCFNRAHAVETLNVELRRARRATQPLSLVMFDIDEFKRVNDTHGHLAGDLVLTEVARRLTQVLRTSDVKCRYGGDEFVVILPDTPEAGARQVAESIRVALSAIVVTVGGTTISVKVSLGVATARGSERNAQSFIAEADRALYLAKEAGGNRVGRAESQAPTPLRLVGASGLS
jgi:diguanylate cyclase (GGDEF)-like protein